MKSIPSLHTLPGLGFLAIALLGLCGCGTLQVVYNGQSGPPTRNVDVFYSALAVGRSHQNLGEGRLEVEGKTPRGDIGNAFVSMGRQQGADAVIITDPADDGGKIDAKDDRTVRGLYIRYSGGNPGHGGGNPGYGGGNPGNGGGNPGYGGGSSQYGTGPTNIPSSGRRW